VSAIIGYCDLLQEEAVDKDSACLKRLTVIRAVASSMANELRQHQCHLDVLTRKEVMGQRTEPSDTKLQQHAG
jgi:hypothetical protein